MPLKQISKFEEVVKCPANDPDHDPPTMIVLEPGYYEHTCPGCGAKQNFVVKRRPTL